MAEAVLALNAGSSSLKFGLYEAASDWAPRTLATGAVRTVAGQQPHFQVQAPDGTTLADEPSTFSGHDAPVERLIEWIEARFPGTGITAVGHRVVHGGMDFGDPIEVDDRTLARIDVLTPLAPLHQPASLEPIRRIKAFRPDLRQFACFDTAFHRTIVPPASRFALPRTFERQGVRRYGFHGLSYESIIAQLKRSGDAQALKPDSRIIVAHLGNGASLCAMRGLKSIDTTMGFSTLDGLVMGTRPGALDPGVLLYLLREQGLPPERLEQLVPGVRPARCFRHFLGCRDPAWVRRSRRRGSARALRVSGRPAGCRARGDARGPRPHHLHRRNRRACTGRPQNDRRAAPVARRGARQ